MRQEGVYIFLVSFLYRAKSPGAKRGVLDKIFVDLFINCSIIIDVDWLDDGG